MGEGWSPVDGEPGDGVVEVVLAGQGVDPGGVERGVAEEFGDGDDVGAGADQVGGEGVAQDVWGDGVFDAGDLGDPGDDPVGGAGRQPCAGAVEE